MARLTGLEPATSGVTGRHSNQLSYNRVGGGIGQADWPVNGKNTQLVKPQRGGQTDANSSKDKSAWATPKTPSKPPKN